MDHPPSLHDPYRIRSLEQLFQLFDAGQFVADVLDKHRQLQIDLIAYRDQHGSKGASGTMTLTVAYAMGKSGDVQMAAKAEFKSPKKPPASASAYIGEDGEMTLFSPLLRRMQHPVRDAGVNYDPTTGEIRNI